MHKFIRVSRFTLMAGAAIIATACGGSAGEPPPPRPVLIEHPQPLAGDVGEVFPGTVRARVEADLAFRVPGKIIARKVDAGDSVQPGDVLAALDPQDARLNTASAEANVAAADADVRLAEAELARQKEMLDKGFTSKSLYEVRENSLKLAQARAEQARSGLAVVRNQAGYTSIVADKAGVITGVLAEAGQVVAAGQPVFRFASKGEREVVIHVPEGRVDAIRQAKLAITLWAQPGKRYGAKLREINLQADRSTRTHEARISIIDADSEVRLGMTATVLMGAKLEGQIYSVPLSALATQADQPVLWIVDDDSRLQPLPVKVLRYLEGSALVSGAIDPQMQIVSAGVQLMVQGQQVTTVLRQREGVAASAGAAP